MTPTSNHVIARAPRPERAAAKWRDVRAREPIAAGVVIMLVYVALGFLRSYAAGTLADDGVYLAVGKSLADGTGYRNIHLVGEPPNTNYPPAVPLLFALIWKVAGGLGAVLTTISVLNLLVCGSAAALLWSVARQRLQLTRAVAAWFVLAPLLLDVSLQHYKLALSEPYFLLGWATLLWLYYHVRDADNARTGAIRAAMLGMTALLVVAVRLQALALVPAVALALAWDRNSWRVLSAYLAGVFAPLLLAAALIGTTLLSRIASAPHFGWIAAGDAGAFAGFAADAISRNFFVYQLRLVHHTAGPSLIGYALVALANLLVAAGAVFLLRRHPAVALTFASTALLVLIWPFNDVRLMAVTLPFAGMVAGSGVDLLVRGVSAHARRLVWLVLCVAALPIVLRQLQFYRDSRDTSARPDSFTLGYALRRNSEVVTNTADWVRQNTAPHDRVMVAQTAGVFLHTGRKTAESNPPQSLLPDVGPAPFATPGLYLASVLLSENVTVLVHEYRGLRVERDADVVRRACPQVLQRWEASPDSSYPAHFRVQRDEPCLQRLLQALRSPPDAQSAP